MRRFRRTDAIRFEVLGLQDAETTARVLDRAGSALDIPVTVQRSRDSEGVSWVSLQLSLAPLAPADYLVELTQKPSNGSAPPPVVAAFRIVP